MEKRFRKNKFYKKVLIFAWHGFFLSLTMSMIDFNTVFPSLITELTEVKVVFGLLYSIMLGAPLVFNIIFSHFMQYYPFKKKFLLIGIYVRSFSFLGMAVFTYIFGRSNPALVIFSFFFWVFLFSISGGFAGLAFTDIIGKLFRKEERGRVYAIKQFFSSLAALFGGSIVARIFSIEEFPLNYTYSLIVGFIGLFIAALAFWLIKEPPSEIGDKKRESLRFFLKRFLLS
ncbi:MFS transporter [Halothermothrix orenii]|uniref:MFS transporter n=1 Tax=Halothermothrix orenii TaxID=31909 RepID=UPI0002FDD43B|nr:MFS transporter [Halothermothrix orenii]